MQEKETTGSIRNRFKTDKRVEIISSFETGYDISRYLAAESIGARIRTETDSFKDLNKYTSNLLIVDVDTFSLPQLKTASRKPFIALSSNTDSDFKAQILEEGAENILPKPAKEWSTRFQVVSVLKRLNDQHFEYPAPTILQSGGLVMNPEERTVFKNGIEVRVNKIEFDLLQAFITKPNMILTNQDVQKILGERSRVLSHYVVNLRRLIEDDSQNPTLIKTVWGIGYKFSEE